MNRQDSLQDQLRTVYDLANKAGCYDAADFIMEHIKTIEAVVQKQLVEEAPINEMELMS